LRLFYASIAQDKNGVPLNMLSLIARRDTDPWAEAAKLWRLPKANALLELRAIFDVGAPNLLTAPEQSLLAERLMALLPSATDSPIAFHALLTSTLSNKRHAVIAYGVAILLLIFGVAFINA
jgi:hypothetical protein